MRLIDAITSPPTVIPGGFSVFTVNGPSYQLTAQSQILRLLFAHVQMRVTASDADTFAVVVGDICLRIIINPNSGADKNINLPASSTEPSGLGNASDTGMNTGADLVSAVGLQVGAEMTVGFDCKNADIRGDDFPNLGGVQIVPPGATGGGVFSIKTQFIYPMAVSSSGGGFTLTHHFDVLADLTDWSETSFKR